MRCRGPACAWLSVVLAVLLGATSGQVAFAGSAKSIKARAAAKKARTSKTTGKPVTSPKKGTAKQSQNALSRKDTANHRPPVRTGQKQQQNARTRTRLNQQQRIAQRGAGRARRGERVATQHRSQMRAERQVRQELGLMARMKARSIRTRAFLISVAAGFGGGIIGRAIEFLSTSRPGFMEPGTLANSPTFGNPMAEMFTSHFVMGAAVAVGVTLVAGTIKAAQIRREGRKIENGTTDLARVDPGRYQIGGRQNNPYVPDQSVDQMPGAGTNLHENLFD